MSCSDEPDKWRLSDPPATTEIVVSGDCHARRWGVVEWQTQVTLQSSLTGPATLKGPCPMVRLLQNASVRDIMFDCTSGDAAIDVVDGRGVTLDNVSSEHAAVFRAAHPEGVSLEGFTAKVSSNHRVMAAIGNGNGNFRIECMEHGTIVSQLRQTALAEYSSLCDTVDLGKLLNVYGRDYEIMFYYKNPDEDLYDSLEREALYYVAIADGVLLAVLLVVHQDYFFAKLK